jgi:hypothetical protein
MLLVFDRGAANRGRSRFSRRQDRLESRSAGKNARPTFLADKSSGIAAHDVIFDPLESSVLPLVRAVI